MPKIPFSASCLFRVVNNTPDLFQDALEYVKELMIADHGFSPVSRSLKSPASPLRENSSFRDQLKPAL